MICLHSAFEFLPTIPSSFEEGNRFFGSLFIEQYLRTRSRILKRQVTDLWTYNWKNPKPPAWILAPAYFPPQQRTTNPFITSFLHHSPALTPLSEQPFHTPLDLQAVDAGIRRHIRRSKWLLYEGPTPPQPELVILHAKARDLIKHIGPRKYPVIKRRRRKREHYPSHPSVYDKLPSQLSRYL